MIKEITENYENTFESVGIDEANKIIKKVCVFGFRKSKNGYEYSDKAIASIARLTEGLKSFYNHPAASERKERGGVRDVRDWLGIFKNVQRSGDKIYADLHCRESSFGLLKDIARLQPQGVGNSINARVKMYRDEKTGQESVIDVDQLRSGDIVASAATVSNLFEAHTKGEEWTAEDEVLLADVLKDRKGRILGVDDFVRSMKGL
ncbi:MAG: hypothetical protein ABIL58_00670 [Pseudomonadota bacterium]